MNTDSMSVAAPSPAERSARQAEVVQALTRVVPQHSLLWHSEDTTPYECDGLTAYRQRPLVRLFATDTASPHAHYLCWRTGAMDRWECAAFAEWLRKTMA